MVNLVLDIICWGKYMKLDDSITSLAGIGPKKAQYLDRLGIHTIYDFITHFGGMRTTGWLRLLLILRRERYTLYWAKYCMSMNVRPIGGE